MCHLYLKMQNILKDLFKPKKTNLKSRKRPLSKKMRIPKLSYYNQHCPRYISSALSSRLHFPAPNIRSNSYARKPLLPLPPLVSNRDPRPFPSKQNGRSYSSETGNEKISRYASSKKTLSQSSEPSFNPLLERIDLHNANYLEAANVDETFYNPLLNKNGDQQKVKPKNNCNLLENSMSSLTLSINTHKSKELKQLSYKEKLKKMAIRHGLEVKYSTATFGQRKTTYVCNLQVGDEKFSSYPVEKPTSDKIEEHIAEVAYKKLKETHKELSPPLLLPETTNIEVVAYRLKEILSTESEGIWWDSLRKKYEQLYHESLSKDYIDTIKQKLNDYISVLKIAGQIPNFILSLKKKIVPLPSNEFGIQNEPPVENIVSLVPPSLSLPEDRMWNIFVSYIKNGNEVWFRIIGEDYSDQFENLVTEMELHYMEENNQLLIISPDVDSYYACNHDESWFRVKFTKMEGESAEIFFVDYGDSEVVSVSKLFQLDSRFLELPCQSVHCTLAGLDGGFDDHGQLLALQNFALGKSLVAEVFSKDDDISVILYDTATDEDININEQLLQMIPESYSEPGLPIEGGICEVYISHVSNEEVFVRVETASFKMLEALLITARQHTAEILGDSDIEIDLSKLYLAKFSADGEWHRAAPRTANKNINGEAIPCKLHNVPSAIGVKWSQKVTDRLLSMTSGGPQLLKVLKVATETEVAHVQLFQRIQPQNLLVSINDTLDLEQTLFCNEDRNNNHSRDFPTDSCGIENSVQSPSSCSLSSCSGEAFDRQELASPLIPPLGHFFDIYVTYAASPSNFAVQSFKNKCKLEMLMDEMFSYYSQELNRKPIKQMYVGGYYALLHTDESWYRVHVLQVATGQISGQFIDYGDFFCASPDAIQTLCTNFRILPQQSYKATLGGIVPVTGDWSPIDCIRFSNLVQDKEFVSQLIGVKHPKDCHQMASYLKEPPILVLKLIDTSDEKLDLYIDQVLIDEGRATSVELPSM